MYNNYTKNIFVLSQQIKYSKIMNMALKIVPPQNRGKLLIIKNAFTIADFMKEDRNCYLRTGLLRDKLMFQRKFLGGWYSPLKWGVFGHFTELLWRKNSGLEEFFLKAKKFQRSHSTI